MKSLPRFAPLLTILVLLALVAIGGTALANNSSIPKVDAEPATIKLNPTTLSSAAPISSSAPALAAPSSATTPVDPAPAPPPAPQQAAVPPTSAPQPAPTPQVPLNYQYYEDDWDDSGDDLDDWDDSDYGDADDGDDD